MKNKKAVVVRNEVLVDSDTGAYYNITTKKQNNITSINVIGTAEEIGFTFSFKDRNELIRFVSAVIIEKIKLEKKVRTAINELQ